MVLFTFGSVAIPANLQEPIVLRIEPLAFTPNHFYIAEIIDERKDPSAVAWLIPSGQGNTQTRAVDLEGGGKVAMEAFILQSLPRNKELRPIVVRIREAKVVESAGPKGVVEGELNLQVSFDLQKESGDVHLVDYQGGMKYKRSANQRGVVEPGLRRTLGNSLEYLHNWMNREVLTNIKLARGVKVFFEDHVENVGDDTVFYTPERPLIWDDFRAKPHPGSYVASVFPSFSWEGRSEVVNGVVHFHIRTKVYMLKNSSWVREGARNAYGLNHEQRHFDIVKLVVERFKEKLLAMELLPEDYDSMLGYQYLEVYREMNRLQDEYDGETRHGINKAAQEKWNRRIDEELRAFGVIE